jgi:hypothetical protein
MIFTNLKIDHIANSEDFTTSKNYYLISKYINKQFRDEKVLIISAILQGSCVSESNIFDNCEIIVKINKYRVNDVNTLRKALIKSSKHKYIKITSLTGNFIIVNHTDAMKEHETLAQIHNFDLSDFFISFQQSFSAKYN